MADDKSKMDQRDRSRVSGSEAYEVEYFARVHGLTVEQVKQLIATHGNDRAKLEKAAAALKRN